MDKKNIYLDNAATTKVSNEVFESMVPYLKEYYGNPSSVYQLASFSKQAIDTSREKLANVLGCEPREIYFTSCGTESDNWAIKGAAMRGKSKGKKHIVTSEFEHHAVLHTVEHLKNEGFEVTIVPVMSNGLVDPKEVEKAIREDTAIVSIMYANNEIGTVQPIAEIGAICRKKGVLFHTDAVQAVGTVEIDVVAQNIDLLSLSGHKLHAPKGIGALYVKKGVVLDTFMDGGGQENRKRAGTENVAFIVGLGVAVEEALSKLKQKNAHLLMLRERYLDGILKLERVHLNGDREKRLPGNANVSFEGIEGEALLLMLDMAGIAASSGSACTSGSLDPSHVLLSIGLPHAIAHGSLRTTFGEDNTIEDVDYLLENLERIVGRLREMSPLWEKIKKENI